jgi:hypothetical protein
MDLENIKQQYRGATLSELVQSHMKTLHKDILPQVIRGSSIEFESKQREMLDHYTDNYLSNWLNQETLNADLADVFDRTICDAKSFIKSKNTTLTDKRIFDVFHVLTLKLTTLVYTDPEIKALIVETNSS